MKIKVLYIIFVTFFWIILGFYILLSSLKESIIFSKYESKIIFNILPQGWAFFTRDPSEAFVEIYEIKNNHIVLFKKQYDFSNSYLGFSRTQRVKVYEIANIIETIPKVKWSIKVNNPIINHINDSIYICNVQKFKFKYFINGEYLFCIKNPIPWAWSNKSQENYVPYQVLRVRIINK